jgi:hypothetical protein
VILYEGIESVELSRNCFVCKFEPSVIKETKTGGLKINYNLQVAQWEKLLEMAGYVFKGKTYFKIT